MNTREAFIACFFTVCSGTSSLAQDAVDINQVNQKLSLTASALADVRVVSATDTERILETTIANEPITFYLMPYSARSEDFEVLVQDATGALRRLDAPPPPRTVRGTVVEWPGSYVVGSLRDGQLTAHIRTANDGDLYIEPLAGRVQGAQMTTHVAYRPADLIPLGYSCGVMDQGPRPHDELAHLAPEIDAFDESAAPRGRTTQATEISFDSDVQFYVANGSSVDATVDDIERVMVGVDAIYRSEVNISYVLNRIVVRTSEPDPYSSFDPSTLLGQFRDEWESTFDAQARDVAHLMTGRDLAGTVIGLAYLDGVCVRADLFNDGGYALSQSRFSTDFARRVALTAHELGHNWSARHCSDDAHPVLGCSSPEFSYDPDCNIMCACLGGCTGILDEFGSAASSEIINFRDGVDCLFDSLSITYVDASYSGPEYGLLGMPYNTFREGLWATDPGGRVVFFGGTYDADRTPSILNRPLTLEVFPGTGVATIGQ